MKKFEIADNALTVLEKRYLKRDEEGKLIETPEQLLERVADNIAKAEFNYGTDESDKKSRYELYHKEFYRLMAELKFLPNTPCLVNAGNNLQMLSACFAIGIHDSMNGIFNTAKAAALISKAGGGFGINFSTLRPSKDLVSTTAGMASGPISFLQVYDSICRAISQGGIRRGAMMAMLDISHPDIESFITCKDDGKSLSNMNISVCVTDEFMEAVQNNSIFKLTFNGKIYKKIKAKELFDKLCDHAHKNGDPGIFFVDEANRANVIPNTKITTTNPCGEQPLLCGTYEKEGEFYPWGEACNLGSINLSKYHDEKKSDLDWKELEKDIQTAVRFLDNVVDMSKFPVQAITDNVKANRKIGLGFMGLADILTMIKIPYNSKAGIKTAEKIMKFINDTATEYSEALAKEKGAFPNQSISSIKKPRRNAAITTLAPTGTISMLADCSGGCEPNFSNRFIKTVMDGKKLEYINPYLEKALKEAKIYSKELIDKIAVNGGMLTGIEEIPEEIRKVFITAQEINYEWHIKMQAALQKHVHSSISKTINLPATTSIEDVRKVYMLAWEHGCKGITVYRDGSYENQVLSTTKTKTETKRPIKQRPNKLVGHTYSMQTGCGKLFVTINESEKKLFEVFATMGKSGACVSAFAETTGRLLSLCFRSEVSYDEVIKQLINVRCNKPCGFGDKSVLSCPDAVAKALKTYLEDKMTQEKNESVKIDLPKEKHIENGGLCPECGSDLQFIEGCKKCLSCGYSACS